MMNKKIFLVLAVLVLSLLLVSVASAGELSRWKPLAGQLSRVGEFRFDGDNILMINGFFPGWADRKVYLNLDDVEAQADCFAEDSESDRWGWLDGDDLSALTGVATFEPSTKYGTCYLDYDYFETH